MDNAYVFFPKERIKFCETVGTDDGIDPCDRPFYEGVPRMIVFEMFLEAILGERKIANGAANSVFTSGGESLDATDFL